MSDKQCSECKMSEACGCNEEGKKGLISLLSLSHSVEYIPASTLVEVSRWARYIVREEFANCGYFKDVLVGEVAELMRWLDNIKRKYVDNPYAVTKKGVSDDYNILIDKMKQCNKNTEVHFYFNCLMVSDPNYKEEK